jgi:hypothetical protein
MSKDPDPKKDEDWDDMLAPAQQTPGLSPDMARALLSMNPKMREEGKNTAWVVREAQSAQKQAKQGAKPQTPSAVVPASLMPKAGTDVTGALQQLKKGFQSETERIEVEKKKLDEEKKKLEQQQAQLKAKLLAELTQWLIAKDPELLSPLTQQALSDNKTFLDGIGFSMKYFIEAKKRTK